MTRARRLTQLDKDIIASIENERRKFDMSKFTIQDSIEPHELPKCGTACCIAGHLLAVRQSAAKRLVNDYRDEYQIFFSDLAAAVYKEETGKECPLDFYCETGDDLAPELGGATREDAIQHIKGVHPHWPLKITAK